jgi:mono/diheme cytochrome c family protein
VSRNDVILTVFAAILVLFSLAVSLWVPRRDPGFPGRSLRTFALIAVLIVAAMLTAVEVFGESHHFGEAEGGEEAATTEATETGGGGGGGGSGGEGDPAAGEQVFAANQCANCHTLQAAGATATIGPNLDETLQGQDPDFIRESIVNPSAQIAEGFQDGLMPTDYGEKLSDEELANLVAFLAQAVQAK